MFVKLQKSIVKHRSRIHAAVEHDRSNGLIESTSAKIRRLTRMALLGLIFSQASDHCFSGERRLER